MELLMPIGAVIGGLVILVISAESLIKNASDIAWHMKLPPLFIGMVIIGFGTSTPELIVSTFASIQGNPHIALGNAFGSNSANIGLILGLAAIIRPIAVTSRVLKRELPILLGITVLITVVLLDGKFSRIDAIILLVLFVILFAWTSLQQQKGGETDSLTSEIEAMGKQEKRNAIKKAIWLSLISLVLLLGSSRILVWGAVDIARKMGIDDIIIGLTIVAIGTSLPELASAIVASRRGESEIALGNVLGSNLFNTLAVTGIAGSIAPFSIESSTLYRDIPVMGGLTLLLFVFGFGLKKRQGRINRLEGSCLLLCYIAYLVVLAIPSISHSLSS